MRQGRRRRANHLRRPSRSGLAISKRFLLHETSSSQPVPMLRSKSWSSIGITAIVDLPVGANRQDPSRAAVGLSQWLLPTDKSAGSMRLALLCLLLHRPQRPRGSAYAGLRRQGRANRPLSSRMPMRRMLIAVFGAAIGADPRARGAGTRRRHLVGLLAAARARLRRTELVRPGQERSPRTTAISPWQKGDSSSQRANASPALALGATGQGACRVCNHHRRQTRNCQLVHPEKILKLQDFSSQKARMDALKIFANLQERQRNASSNRTADVIEWNFLIHRV
jgi:hypothetical protein